MAIMLLRPADGRFAPSRNPYWFDLDSVDDENTVGAVWVGRKNRRTTITLGTYHLFPARLDWREGFNALEPLDKIARADTRYGGNWKYRFDGVRHLTEPTADQDHEQAIRDRLEHWHAGLPASLDDWSGPFCPTPVTFD